METKTPNPGEVIVVKSKTDLWLLKVETQDEIDKCSDIDTSGKLTSPTIGDGGHTYYKRESGTSPYVPLSRYGVIGTYGKCLYVDDDGYIEDCDAPYGPDMSIGETLFIDCMWCYLDSEEWFRFETPAATGMYIETIMATRNKAQDTAQSDK